ncbi:ADP-ribosylglycohydrolase family protein [Streptomyces tubbatahanensis]|uniref:ADP-ribosylglycohydrolase family protein n=1 Tax=Streptomyces tubbatahanensis TaxID=2923272 RepID=A0ABY3XXZ2_9ACTN|nr:ADP-ribosylglycohydrolase family protein [Streptomyces tubbatahanensis]UNS99394.1 ADP-ribosylglycohydrolase family protein [Streptomyces tubbatahanensis]
MSDRIPDPVAAERISRALASLRGLAVGDALGSQFFVPDNLPFLRRRELPPGRWQWTDDTEMAASLVAVLARHGSADQNALATSFATHHDFDRDYGPAVHRMLRLVRQEGGDWRELASSLFEGQGSWGNGGAMRVAPLGAWFADDPDRAADEAARSAEVTHRHPEAVAGTRAVAAAAALVAADGHDRPATAVPAPATAAPATSSALRPVHGEGPPASASRPVQGEGPSTSVLRPNLGDGPGLSAEGQVAGAGRAPAEGRAPDESTAHAGPPAVRGQRASGASSTAPLIAETLLLEVLKRVPRSAVHAGLRRAIDLLDYSDVGTVAAVLGCGRRTSTQDTVPFTLWAAARHLGDFRAAVWTTAGAGGDVDTTCAIVGGIVAAGGPAAAPPEEWDARTEGFPPWLVENLE